jgi:hypothetical protein
MREVIENISRSTRLELLSFQKDPWEKVAPCQLSYVSQIHIVSLIPTFFTNNTLELEDNTNDTVYKIL